MKELATELLGGGEFFLRLVFAFILGGLIGLERQAHGRPAGMRTIILVCLGSAAVIIAFEKLFPTAAPPAGSLFRPDSARVAAGVITGIGFLGAGTIIRYGDFVMGLTTAATIWVVSAIGVVLGLGQYLLALVISALVLLTLYALDRFKIHSDRYGEIRIEGEGGSELYEKVRARIENYGLEIKNYRLRLQPEGDTIAVTFAVKYGGEATGSRLAADLSRTPGVKQVSWK